ncbi:MAG TPA: S-methyl-5'-thioadenosine phosphorylase [Phycisphaerales bacterium]|nr:S-methyl-5'-thioadenosine phosphorylase [Phycisphaerales bacterium]
MSDGLVGVIGGSGLGDALLGHLTDVEVEQVDTPFGAPSSSIQVGKMGSKRIAFLNRHGDGHRYGPSEVNYAANIFALKKLGVTALLASGAVGSLKEVIKPKELIVVDQFIDKTFRRQGSFFGKVGAVHCEMAEPCCGRLREAIITASRGINARTHLEGTYICMEGPQFSTRAESMMHIAWGGDLIGMTAMPEAKLAREAQMCYGLIALASDYDCWREHAEQADKQELLKEIIGNLTAATENAIELIKATLEGDIELCSDECGCRKSLELAVWSRPKEMDQDEMKKLEVLFE